MDLNKIYNENCLDTMAKMPSDFIDLTVTSPPYDDLRVYNGYSFDFEAVAKELFRVTKQGGVLVWVIGDACVNGTETGTSLKQALFLKETGFNLHDTMIWYKLNPMPQTYQPRYTQSFEYMFVFSKGKPNTFQPLKTKCTIAGTPYRNVKVNSNRKDPERRLLKTDKVVPEERNLHNVWPLGHASRNYGHSAVFPEKLVENHINSWTVKGNLVYDPFLGSGTTAFVALENEREFIGSEISAEYCEIGNQRIKMLLRDKEILERFVKL